jgi:hypothetical protein
VGLGLRNLATCPVEMNLMPESTLRWQSFNQKKPYLIATVFSLALVAGAVGLMFQKLAVNKEKEVDRLQPQVSELTVKSDKFKQAFSRFQKARKDADQITIWLQERYYWCDFTAEMRSAFIRSEEIVRKKLSPQRPNVDVGIWIEQMTPATKIGAASAGGVPTGGFPGGMPGGFPGGRMPGFDMPGMDMPPPPPPSSSAESSSGQTNVITFICRAVNLSGVDPSANGDIAYAVENQIKASPLVDPKATQLVGQITIDEATGTFTFTVNVTPLNPLKF